MDLISFLLGFTTAIVVYCLVLLAIVFAGWFK